MASRRGSANMRRAVEAGDGFEHGLRTVPCILPDSWRFRECDLIPPANECLKIMPVV
jgi:hypothetical protein